ncbi:MAG: hypothetical protein ACE5JO_03850, partial [Candidatus Binatia bacterium]
RFRGMWAIQRFRRDFTGGGSQDGVNHRLAGSRGWYIRQGLMIWGPKGFLTGKRNKPGSLRFSVGFERLDIDQGSPTHLVSGRLNVRRMTVLLRQFNLTYFVRRNFKFFAQYEWYSFNKLNGLSSSRRRGLGCFETGDSDRTAGCDYGALELGFQYRF